MRITPADIMEKKFPLTYKGFEVAEVSAFLDIVREEMEELMRENESLRGKLKEYKNLETLVWDFIEKCIKSRPQEKQVE